MRQSLNNRLDAIESKLDAQRLQSQRSTGFDFSALTEDELIELEKLMDLGVHATPEQAARAELLWSRVKVFDHDTYHKAFTERRAEIGDDQMRKEMSDYFDDRLNR